MTETHREAIYMRGRDRDNRICWKIHWLSSILKADYESVSAEMPFLALFQSHDTRYNHAKSIYLQPCFKECLFLFQPTVEEAYRVVSPRTHMCLCVSMYVQR